MVSAGKGNSSATFQVKLDSFQSDGTTITDGATFFHAAIGDVARMDENGVVSLTDGSNQQQTQSGAIHSKQKIDLTKDFELTLEINTPSDPSGLVFLFHNDPRGRVALSFGGRSLGAYGDSTIVENSHALKNLDELLGFYNEMISQYDRYAGLDPKAEDVLDRNVKSKYLVKANKHGAGAGYYSDDHTAQNGASMSAFLGRGWLVYHEVAHGYEGNLRNNGIFLQETLNNVFGYYYEQKYLKPGEGGWLGIFDNIEHSQFQNMRDRGFDDANYSTRLYFFVNLLNSTGNVEEASAALHKQNRRDAANGVSRLSQDLMVDVWSEYTKHNYVPYMQYASIALDERLVADIYEREYPISYFLQELVGEEKATQIKEELGLKGELSLVDASMLEP
ncbi:MAG: M60 family metallopeptidase, partial [Erysipelotrichaceae bacterium]|nr:M60 family metallopeptidase [Erysipelotrichaceae bacterium]